MIIDLKHNKIIESTMTEAFAKSFEDNLVPELISKYGENITLVQMYEDHIADGFLLSGEFYYPLTVVLGGEVALQWIKWKIGKGDFDGKSPYAFLGKNLQFELVDSAPAEFSEKLVGRARYCESGLVKLRVETTAKDMTFLSGKYSQTFLDEMARQLTSLIEDTMSVTGVSNSSLELCLVFSPESYMEHTSENVTYRRLLITDNSGAPKDFWIKWTRLDGATGYNVSANVTGENILFEIGEDVNQKIREKEYRFLLNTKGKDKYHNAMGRKNITDWREVVKRLVKKGELVKVEAETTISKETEDLTKSLADILAQSAPRSVGEEVVASPESDKELLEALEFARERLVMEEAEEESEETDEPDESDEEQVVFTAIGEDDQELIKASEAALEDIGVTEIKFADEPSEEIEEEIEIEIEIEDESEESDEEFSDEGEEEPEDEALEEETEEETEEDEPAEEISAVRVVVPEDPCKEEYCEGEYSEIEDEESLEEDESDELIEELRLLDGEPEEEAEEKEEPAAVDIKEIEDKIRRELEAKLRLEYEIDARKRAESEAERLRKENEKLIAEAKKLDELKAERERARLEETERLRSQIEAQLRAEARERERLAEAARAAVEEQRRIEEEKARLESIRREEEERAEAERAAKELEAKRAAEVERITKETEARIRAEYEAKKAEEEAASAPAVNVPEQKRVREDDEVNSRYTYTSKNVRLLFRRSVDPNITARIHEIIKATLDYYGKSKVYLKIRATVPDSQTVVLEFVKIPMEEMELLGNLIKVLGNSGLGIAKAIVE